MSKKIADDLARHLGTRVMKACDAMTALCETSNIAPQDCQLAQIEVLMAITMALFYHINLNLTPRDIGLIAETQYTTFLRMKKEQDNASHST